MRIGRAFAAPKEASVTNPPVRLRTSARALWDGPWTSGKGTPFNWLRSPPCGAREPEEDFILFLALGFVASPVKSCCFSRSLCDIVERNSCSRVGFPLDSAKANTDPKVGRDDCCLRLRPLRLGGDWPCSEGRVRPSASSCSPSEP